MDYPDFENSEIDKISVSSVKSVDEDIKSCYMALPMLEKQHQMVTYEKWETLQEAENPDEGIKLDYISMLEEQHQIMTYEKCKTLEAENPGDEGIKLGYMALSMLKEHHQIGTYEKCETLEAENPDDEGIKLNFMTLPMLEAQHQIVMYEKCETLHEAENSDEGIKLDYISMLEEQHQIVTYEKCKTQEAENPGDEGIKLGYMALSMLEEQHQIVTYEKCETLEEALNPVAQNCTIDDGVIIIIESRDDNYQTETNNEVLIDLHEEIVENHQKYNRMTELKSSGSENRKIDPSTESLFESRNDEYSLKSCCVVLSKLDEKVLKVHNNHRMLLSLKKSLIESTDDKYKLNSCRVILTKLEEETLKVHNCHMMSDNLKSRTKRNLINKSNRKIKKDVYTLGQNIATSQNIDSGENSRRTRKLKKVKYCSDESSEDSDDENSWSIDEEEGYTRQRKNHCLNCLCDQSFKNLKHLFEHICKYKKSKGYLCKVCKKSSSETIRFSSS